MHVEILYLGVFSILTVGNLLCFIPGFGRLYFRHLRLQLSTKLCLSIQLSKITVVREVKYTFTFSKELKNLYFKKIGCKTRFSAVKNITYDIFEACISS